MKRILLPLIAAAILTAVSCSKDAAPAPSLSFECRTGMLPGDGGSGSVTVSWSHCKWQIREEGGSMLAAISPVYAGSADSEGSITISFTVSPNPGTESRSTTLVASDLGGSVSASITLTQEGKTVSEKETIEISIDPSTVYQTIDGFGAMGGWGTGDAWSEEETDQLLGRLGLSIMRIRIAPDESEWPRISEVCKYATEKYGVKILASPWTMPAYMKDNGSLNGSTGGVYSHLLPEFYEEYALYLEKFASFMKENGTPLYAISMQNEPDWPAEYEGCLWSGENHRDFLAGYGHLIKSALVVSGESLNTNHSFYEPALENDKACASLDIIGGHLYGKAPDSFKLAEEKGKRLWMTEHLLNDSWNGNSGHWAETLDMAVEISRCLTSGWSAYIWWYGRRYYSLIGDGEQGTSRGRILPRGHAFGQFSRHILPGFTRIGAAVRGGGDLEVSAFKGDDRLILVVINTTSSTVSNVVADFGSDASGAVATFTNSESNSENLSLSATGTKVTLSLPSRSITTIVL